MNPGPIDGIYGSGTTFAVKHARSRCRSAGVAQDGIVGPDTWRCLRLGPTTAPDR